MAWQALRFSATAEAIDWIRTLLPTTGYSDAIQIAPAGNEQWAFLVCLYFPAAARRQMDAVADRLSPLYRTGQISEPETALVEQRATSAAAPQRVGDRFVILPPEAPYAVAPGDRLIRLATTQSFGSGFHAATQLCLRLIERHIQPQMHTLDLGCGSGILSIAMAQLGARVLALDNDRLAVQATQDAVDRNQVTAQVTVRQGSLGGGNQLGHWLGDQLEPAILEDLPAEDLPIQGIDAIVANLLARIHITLAADYRAALAPAGLLIAAGFTTEYADQISASLAGVGFEAIDREQTDEWIALVYRQT